MILQSFPLKSREEFESRRMEHRGHPTWGKRRCVSNGIKMEDSDLEFKVRKYVIQKYYLVPLQENWVFSTPKRILKCYFIGPFI